MQNPFVLGQTYRNHKGDYVVTAVDAALQESGFSNEAIIIQVIDMSGAGDNLVWTRNYDGSSTNAAKLEITWTP